MTIKILCNNKHPESGPTTMKTYNTSQSVHFYLFFKLNKTKKLYGIFSGSDLERWKVNLFNKFEQVFILNYLNMRSRFRWIINWMSILLTQYILISYWSYCSLWAPIVQLSFQSSVCVGKGGNCIRNCNVKSERQMTKKRKCNKTVA